MSVAAQTTSKQSFVNDLFLNVKVSHPVTIIYTDDPNETVALTKATVPAIRDTNDKILYWSSRLNWTDISDRNKSFAQQLGNPTVVKVPDEAKKTPLAYTFLSPEKIGAKYPIFIMSLLSVQVKKDVMGLMQELRDFDYMVRSGVNNTYRLIIIANKSFEIPEDYENLFGVIHHDLPVKAEIESIYDTAFMEDYLEALVQKLYDGNFKELKAQFASIKNYVVNTLAGLSERQIRLIMFKAFSKNHTKIGKLVASVDIDGFKEYLYREKFKEISKSGIINLMRPIPMEDVGGLEYVKSWLLQRKKAFGSEAREKGIKRPKGMVLVGPSGTGKSYVAKATAGVLNFPCVELNLSSIFNKYVGESESNMESIKAQIEAMAPAVVFVDEIDKVFAGENRGATSDSGVTARVLGKLLTWIQETNAELFFVVTANRVQNIPAELLRKGRFDEIWCVTFPTRKERKEILNIHLQMRNQSVKNLDKVITATHDFSAAELEHIVAEAILQAYFSDEKLSEKHLLEEVRKTNPLSEAFKSDIEYMRKWAETHARKASVPEVEETQTVEQEV